MSEVGSFLGVHWKGDLSWNTDADRQILISERQWMALVKCCQAAQEASCGTIPAIPVVSWLVGLAHASQSLASMFPLEQRPPVVRRYTRRHPSRTAEAHKHQIESETDFVPPQSVNSLLNIQTSSSSSVLADGESGDSVAADPRNDATPDPSVKGVRDDA